METILLVDDEAQVLKLCQRILRLGGYEVIAAGSGAEALRLLQGRTEKIDLALLDIMMPGMNGVELAKRVHVIQPDAAVVLMTGFGPNEIAQLLRDSSYRIVWKPFRTESLLRMIENALSGSTGTS